MPIHSDNQAGLRCPRCHNGGALNVQCFAMVKLTAEGVELVSDLNEPAYRLSEGHALCDACEWEGKIADLIVIGRTFPSDGEWTGADVAAAYAEGWNLFDSAGSDNGRTQLCRDDEAFQGRDGYSSDDAAHAHVVTKAREGSALHIKALRLVAKHNPAEAAAITKGTGFDFSTIIVN